MEHYSERYNGDTYHLIVKNCNHFCDDICQKLTGKRVPKWVNRLARIGSMCNCILPEGLRTSVSGLALVAWFRCRGSRNLRCFNHPRETAYCHHRNQKDRTMFYVERKG
ncbi:hypothetical protein V6N13_142031 [Hibiscus sabdariffa]|uniref:PPPDE domain-containing protein n=1 Tax=Hibiscus sabdariffa TaxID=183260 RepID=A0ABR2FCY7_9ROSI